MICKLETNRYIIEIFSSNNWRKGNPIDPNIKKWLVKVTDKVTHDEFFPENPELKLLTSTMNEIDLIILSWALKIKERHNFGNLKNPEKRPIESYIHKDRKSVV